MINRRYAHLDSWLLLFFPPSKEKAVLKEKKTER
jgi:hypothetical protein